MEKSLSNPQWAETTWRCVTFQKINTGIWKVLQSDLNWGNWITALNWLSGLKKSTWSWGEVVLLGEDGGGYWMLDVIKTHCIHGWNSNSKYKCLRMNTQSNFLNSFGTHYCLWKFTRKFYFELILTPSRPEDVCLFKKAWYNVISPSYI